MLVAMENLQVQTHSQQRIVDRVKWRIEQAASKDLTELFGRPIAVSIIVSIHKS